MAKDIAVGRSSEPDDILCVICDCHDKEHQLWLQWDTEEENIKWQQLFLTMHLGKVGFWRRLKYAFLYLFGRQSRYGAFTEIVVSDTQAEKLRDILTRYLERNK